MFRNVINIAVIILSSYIHTATSSSLSSECIPNTQNLYIASNHEFQDKKSELQLLYQQSIYHNGIQLNLNIYQDVNDCKTASQLIKELCENIPINHLSVTDQEILNPQTIENIHNTKSSSFQSTYHQDTTHRIDDNEHYLNLITNFKSVNRRLRDELLQTQKENEQLRQEIKKLKGLYTSTSGNNDGSDQLLKLKQERDRYKQNAIICEQRYNLWINQGKDRKTEQQLQNKISALQHELARLRKDNQANINNLQNNIQTQLIDLRKQYNPTKKPNESDKNEVLDLKFKLNECKLALKLEKAKSNAKISCDDNVKQAVAMMQLQYNSNFQPQNYNVNGGGGININNYCIGFWNQAIQQIENQKNVYHEMMLKIVGNFETLLNVALSGKDCPPCIQRITIPQAIPPLGGNKYETTNNYHHHHHHYPQPVPFVTPSNGQYIYNINPDCGPPADTGSQHLYQQVSEHQSPRLDRGAPDISCKNKEYIILISDTKELKLRDQSVPKKEKR